MKIKIFYVNLFILALACELMIMPFLFVLDHGLSLNINSAYFARFSYICLAIIAVCFMLHVTRKPLLYFHCLFFFGLILGVMRGYWNNSINSQFFSHIFFYLMPPLILTFGYNVASYLTEERALLNRFQNFLICTIILTFVFLALQLSFNYLGLADYPKFSLNALIFSFPLLAGHLWYFLALPTVFLANKLTYYLPVIFLSVLSLFFMFGKLKKVLIQGYLVLCITIALGVGAWLYLNIHENYGFFDELSSRRLSEAFSAFGTIDFLGWSGIFGHGFGWTYIPWPDAIDESGASYSEFESHYVHLGNFSYLMISGVLFYSVFWILMARGMFLSFGLLARDRITVFERYLLMVFLSVLLLSIFGANLTSSSYCWFFIGGAHFVINKYQN